MRVAGAAPHVGGAAWGSASDHNSASIEAPLGRARPLNGGHTPCGRRHHASPLSAHVHASRCSIHGCCRHCCRHSLLCLPGAGPTEAGEGLLCPAFPTVQPGRRTMMSCRRRSVPTGRRAIPRVPSFLWTASRSAGESNCRDWGTAPCSGRQAQKSGVLCDDPFPAGAACAWRMGSFPGRPQDRHS